MKLDLMSEIQTGSPAAGASKPIERPATGAAGQGRPAAGAGTGAPPPSSMTVTLSPQSQALATQGSNADVDTAKVESIKSSIANGSFTINAEAIADKLLSNASEMLSAARR
jgi:negative regulator of flagellin synthesis FlgM